MCFRAHFSFPSLKFSEYLSDFPDRVVVNDHWCTATGVAVTAKFVVYIHSVSQSQSQWICCQISGNWNANTYISHSLQLPDWHYQVAIMIEHISARGNDDVISLLSFVCGSCCLSVCLSVWSLSVGMSSQSASFSYLSGWLRAWLSVTSSSFDSLQVRLCSILPPDIPSHNLSGFSFPSMSIPDKVFSVLCIF